MDICVAEAYAKWHGSGACDVPNQVRCIPGNQRLDFKYTKYKKWFAPVAGHQEGGCHGGLGVDFAGVRPRKLAKVRVSSY